jgi:hypothetical protein
MPRTLNDDAFEALSKTIATIDFRAKRLFEWRDFGTLTRTIQAQLERFTSLQKAGQAPQNLDDLRECWDDCELKLIQLQQSEYTSITRPLAQANGAGAPNWLTDTVAELSAAAKDLGDALQQANLGTLATHLQRVVKAMRRIQAQREASVDHEMAELPLLTNELRSRF